MTSGPGWHPLRGGSTSPSSGPDSPPPLALIVCPTCRWAIFVATWHKEPMTLRHIDIIGLRFGDHLLTPSATDW